MRKLLVFFFVALSISVVLFSSSCKQCNNTTPPVVKVDTLPIPQLNAINKQIQADSLNPFLYYKRAQIYEANNDIKSASTDMFIALTLDSIRPEFYLYAAELFKKSGEPQRGVALMSKAIVTDSMNTKYYVKAAELIYIDTTIKGNYQLALDYLNTAIDKDPQNADIYFYKGNVYKEKGDTGKAISSFQTATELNPRFYDAYVQIGLLLDKKKDKNAEKYLDNAIKVSDQPEDALYAKANIYKEQGVNLLDANKEAQAIEKFQKAIENFKKVIEINHRNVEACMGIGYSYYQMDSLEQAYKYYGMAAKVEPDYAGAYFSQGLVAEDMGRKQEAMSLYQSCLNIDPTFKKAEEHLSKLKTTP